MFNESGEIVSRRRGLVNALLQELIRTALPRFQILALTRDVVS